MKLFDKVQVKKPDSNRFDLTHDVKMSGKMGNLMPVMVLETIPGDKIKLAADSLIRFAPLVSPVMHRFDATIHYFFVPNRIIWENWTKYIRNEQTGGLPTILIDSTLTNPQKIFLDYMGIPPCPVGGVPTPVNALPFAAYQMVYNRFYRDQNLIGEIPINLVDGNNPIGELATMRKRAYEHDYFTSALPFAQKGQAVDIPLGDVSLKPGPFANPNGVIDYSTGGNFPGANLGSDPTAGDLVDIPTQRGLVIDPAGSLEVEPTTISTLRRAFKLQEWFELMARSGSRYIEFLKSFFGVNPSDKSLSQPEYITGTKSPVVISEVLNMTGENAGLPQGNMAGHAVSVGEGYVGDYYCEEHGYIIGIMSIMPKTAYQQGINKNFLKTDPLDWYFPQFAHIGEQPIQNQELYAYTPTKEETFGYIPRYSEYKYMPSRVAGDFRNSLAYWHGGRIFSSQPTLSQTFIEMNPNNLDRLFAVQDGTDYLYIHILNKISAIRKMPVYGNPML